MREQMYIGVDVDMESLRNSQEEMRVCADGGSLPFHNGSFDLVSSNMVFEHLDDPVATLQEVNRVLDDEGVFIIHTASSRHYMLLAGRTLSSVLPREKYRDLVSCYTGRRSEDIFLTRYRANTVRKLSKAATKAGFRGGFISYLETPLDFPPRIRSIEKYMRRLLPKSLKSTLLAIYIKNDWT
jgi:ubiquinone/menaquinone biosynthesis C-methylase UbiE